MAQTFLSTLSHTQRRTAFKNNHLGSLHTPVRQGCPSALQLQVEEIASNESEQICRPLSFE